MPFWTKEDETTLATMHKAGAKPQEIADALGRSARAVRAKLEWYGGRGSEQPAAAVTVPAGEPEKMQAASTDARVKQLEQQIADLLLQGKQQRVAVEAAAEKPSDPAEAWARAEADAEQHIEYTLKRAHFTAELGNEVVAVSFVSDQHISPGNTVDFRRMREDAELIANTPGLFACLGGDGVDNHIRIPAAIMAARSQPGDQWQLYEWYLGILASKIIALISGNHDAWTDQVAGIDMVSQLAARQKICYAPAEAWIDAKVGEQTYKIAFRHQYKMNSTYNQGHAVKQWWRMGPQAFDIGCVCHHHEPSVESFIAHGVDRWACRPGSYQITSAYSRQYGFNATMPTCPTFLLFPDERRIIGFRDVRDAVKVLAAERN